MAKIGETPTMTSMPRAILTLLALVSLLLPACVPSSVLPQGGNSSSRSSVQARQANMPNPASVYCNKHSGRTDIRTATDGSQSGFCVFASGAECDEWMFFRGECLISAEESIPDDWKRYSNAAYAFSVRHPADWKIVESSRGAVELSGSTGSLRFLGVEVSKPYETAPAELVALASRYGTQMRRVTLNGVEGWVRDDEGGGRTYYMEHGTAYVEIMTNKEQMENNAPLEMVISTFVFLK